VIGKLFIFLWICSNIESVSSLHLRYVGRFVVKASRTKRAWQPRTFPNHTLLDILRQSDSSLDPPLSTLALQVSPSHLVLVVYRATDTRSVI